jgi:hypothetical protein
MGTLSHQLALYRHIGFLKNSVASEGFFHSEHLTGGMPD